MTTIQVKCTCQTTGKSVVVAECIKMQDAIGINTHLNALAIVAARMTGKAIRFVYSIVMVA